MSPLRLLCILLTLIAVNPEHVLALDSTRFSDVITSNGRSNIDLFNASSPNRFLDSVFLEYFRRDNEASMMFALDINEPAFGTEKVSS
jgi:hypothetical protein